MTLKNMRHNMKTLEQKIDNIVKVVAESGSPALLNQLSVLEKEKAELEIAISKEEKALKENELREEDISAAFYKARQMFRSGELKAREVLINLYLDCVIVHPDYIEIHFNQIPDNLMKTIRIDRSKLLECLASFKIITPSNAGKKASILK